MDNEQCWLKILSASQTLLLKALLALKAGESKLDALGEWILQATTDELAEELDSRFKGRSNKKSLIPSHTEQIYIDDKGEKSVIF